MEENAKNKEGRANPVISRSKIFISFTFIILFVFMLILGILYQKIFFKYDLNKEIKAKIHEEEKIEEKKQKKMEEKIKEKTEEKIDEKIEEKNQRKLEEKIKEKTEEKIDAKIEAKKENIEENKEKIKEKRITPKNHNQELVEKLKEVNKKIYDFLSLTNYYYKYIDDEQIKTKIMNIRKKYNIYLNIKRFAIPIIGSVSVGKSTVLNYLLNLRNFLETGRDITTRFLCIIRHNVNYEVPIISNITIKERDLFKYNFIINKKINEDEPGINYIREYNRFFSLIKI